MSEVIQEKVRVKVTEKYRNLHCNITDLKVGHRERINLGESSGEGHREISNLHCNITDLQVGHSK